MTKQELTTESKKLHEDHTRYIHCTPRYHGNPHRHQQDMPKRIYSTRGISIGQQRAREMLREGHANIHWCDWEAFSDHFHTEARKFSKNLKPISKLWAPEE